MSGDREIKTRIQPYEDGSGYKFEAHGDCEGPPGGRVRVRLIQGDDRIEMTSFEWMEVKAMMDEAFGILVSKPVVR